MAPLGDAGCDGLEAGECSEFRTTFGCFCVFQDDGSAVGLCVD
jgi:hypothetical protein